LYNNTLKLGDFGVAVQIPKTDKTQTGFAGTIPYMGPEIFKQIGSDVEPSFSIKTDAIFLSPEMSNKEQNICSAKHHTYINCCGTRFIN
jgi:serine/threonine protein kinase